jgi:hypothetical protein
MGCVREAEVREKRESGHEKLYGFGMCVRRRGKSELSRGQRRTKRLFPTKQVHLTDQKNSMRNEEMVFKLCKNITRRIKRMEEGNGTMLIEEDENKIKKSQAKKSKHKRRQD